MYIYMQTDSGSIPLAINKIYFFSSSRGDTVNLGVTAEGILPLYGLQQWGYYHSVGYSRGVTATLWVTTVGILLHSVGYSRGDTATLSAGL